MASATTRVFGGGGGAHIVSRPSVDESGFFAPIKLSRKTVAHRERERHNMCHVVCVEHRPSVRRFE